MARGKRRPLEHAECPLCGGSLQTLRASLHDERRAFLYCTADDAAWEILAPPKQSRPQASLGANALSCSAP